MILPDAPDVPGARMARRALLVLGMVFWPTTPAAVSGGRVQDATPKVESPKDKPSSDPKRIRVKASRPIQREVRDYVDLAGRIEPVMTVSLRARVSGRINKVYRVPGQKVRKGDLLYAIDPQPYEAGLEKAEAEVRVARARLEAKRAEAEIEARDGKAPGKGSQLQGECEAAQAAVEAAEKARDVAKLDLMFTDLTSPIDGNILGPIAQAGNVAVADTTTLATIVSTDPMYVYFDVPQDIVLKLKRQKIEGKIKIEQGTGFPVRVSLAEKDGFPRRGTLNFLNDALDPRTNTALWRASIPNREELLLPGMPARVRVTLGASRRALLVGGLIYSRGTEYLVQALTPEGKIEQRRVELGLKHDDLWEVRKGLEADEWVVVEVPRDPSGYRLLPEGQSCDVEKVPMPDGSSSGLHRLR